MYLFVTCWYGWWADWYPVENIYPFIHFWEASCIISFSFLFYGKPKFFSWSWNVKDSESWVKSMEASHQCPYSITSLTCTLVYAFDVVLDRRQTYQTSCICCECHAFWETSVNTATFHTFPKYYYANFPYCSKWCVIICSSKNALVPRNVGGKKNLHPDSLNFFKRMNLT